MFQQFCKKANAKKKIPETLIDKENNIYYCGINSYGSYLYRQGDPKFGQYFIYDPEFFKSIFWKTVRKDAERKEQDMVRQDRRLRIKFDNQQRAINEAKKKIKLVRAEDATGPIQKEK